MAASILVIVGGLIAALDSSIGSIALLGLAIDKPNELLMGLSFTLGLPMYLVDARRRHRIVLYTPALFVVRWIARCFAGPTPTLVTPFAWPLGALLFLALVLLQLSKLCVSRS
jgi:hypothetical protein